MLTRILKGLTERYENWRRWRRAYEELAALDDRSLADIGITRSEIPYVLSRRPATDARPARQAAVCGLRHAA
ncbi:MAG TPA: DUF1127 domain-containing protein [Stellaceae bacterium]|nr:DUF1127 domain-containing protein [Stellaceae bacterium]